MRDYFPMLAAADQLAAFQGFLDTQGIKLRNEAQARFNDQVKKFVFEIMRNEDDVESLISSVNFDIDQFVSANSGIEDFSTALIRNSVISRIEKDSRRPAWLRQTIRWAPIAAGIGVVAIYFSIIFMSVLDLSAPDDTKLGIQQRAAAAEKVIRYDEWMHANVRRGGFLKGILLWPIEPSGAEIRAASEFASTTLSGYEFLNQRREICGTLVSSDGERLSQEQVRFVSDIADRIQQSGLNWQTPPVMTILDQIRGKFPCATSS